MKIEFENRGNRYRCDMDSGVSLARPIQFSGEENNPWNVLPPSKRSVEAGDFVGSTQRGGSCNVDQLSLIPHCHGTHTESIGHIVDADFFVSQLAIHSLVPAVVVSISPVLASSTAASDSYQPPLADDDSVVTAACVRDQLGQWSGFAADALIVRTGTSDAFFSNEAMALIVEAGFEHLLVDFSSVDRLNDEGLLSNHRIFWNVEMGDQKVNKSSRTAHTITELIHVPDQVDHGPCLLSMQVPSIESDAAPSRPVVYSINQI